MRWIIVALVCWSFPASAAAQDKPTPMTFGKADAGKLPAGWAAAKTGTGEGSVWQVRADDSAPSGSGHVLTQTAAGPKPLFNLCVWDRPGFADGELSVAVKAVSGAIDQGGGPVWRYQDANNYYTARYNPLEANFRVYAVVGGKRTQLATKEDVILPAGKWFTVGVRHIGTTIECSLNGEKHLVVTDGAIPKPGKVGLWTKADAVTSFDELTVAPARK